MLSVDVKRHERKMVVILRIFRLVIVACPSYNGNQGSFFSLSAFQQTVNQPAVELKQL